MHIYIVDAKDNPDGTVEFKDKDGMRYRVHLDDINGGLVVRSLETTKQSMAVYPIVSNAVRIK